MLSEDTEERTDPNPPHWSNSGECHDCGDQEAETKMCSECSEDICVDCREVHESLCWGS